MEYSQSHYQQQLSQLTLNSRALITELTTLAERHVDKCNEISEMVESRIRKCLPQHKLYVIYLMDSICKNVGNPYNLIFGNKLFRIFTETYSLVTDTPTRQHLINLFKTWIFGRTTGGSELFPEAILQRIEKFIISATSLGNGGSSGGSESPDYYLKEARALLQFIITLNKNIDQLGFTQFTPEQTELLESAERRRNTLVAIVNDTCDNIIAEMREGIDIKKYASELAEVRKELQAQLQSQDALIRTIEKRKEILAAKKALEHEKRDRVDNYKKYVEGHKVVIGPIQYVFFSNITEGIKENKDFREIVENWGNIPIVDIPEIEEPKEKSVAVKSPIITEKLDLAEAKPVSNDFFGNTLGLNFDLEEPDEEKDLASTEVLPLTEARAETTPDATQDSADPISDSENSAPDVVSESSLSSADSNEIISKESHNLSSGSDEEYAPQSPQPKDDTLEELRGGEQEEEYDEDADYDPTFASGDILAAVPPSPQQEHLHTGYILEDYTRPRSILKRRNGEESTIAKKRVRFTV